MDSVRCCNTPYPTGGLRPPALYGAGRTRTVVLVRVPSALPMLFTSLRIGVTHAMTGAIFVEYVGAKQGLGI